MVEFVGLDVLLLLPKPLLLLPKPLLLLPKPLLLLPKPLLLELPNPPVLFEEFEPKPELLF